MRKISLTLFILVMFSTNTFAATIWNNNASNTSATLDPSPYENDSDDSSTLSIAGATKLQVTITGDLESQSTCGYDYVTLTPNTGTPTSGTKYCGSINDTFVIESDHIDLVFHSDFSVVRDGVTVTITEVPNTPPIADAGPDQSVFPGTMVTLSGEGTDSDGSITNYLWTEEGVTLSTDASFSKGDFLRGTHILTFTVTDNDGATATDTMTVTIKNTPPVVEDMHFTIGENKSVTFTLSATDDDNDTIVSFPLTSAPNNGSLSFSDNNITYTPDINFTGIDVFNYTANDGIDTSNTATITIEVVPAATAVHDDYNTTYLTPLSGNVITNVLTKDLGLNLTLIDFNLTRDDNLTQICNLTQDFNGSLNISNDGDFIYYPEDRFAGNIGFYYTIKDDLNNTSSTSVCITVYPPRNDLSIIKSAPIQVDGGESIDYTLSISSALGDMFLPALDVVVVDELPPGVIYNGVTAPSEWTCSEQGGTISCGASTISPGYTTTITIHVFAPHSLGNITNTASIDSGTPDPDRTNNTSSATTDVRGTDVDLSIVKTVSSPTVTTTSKFSYTLEVSNNGTAEASGVTVTDTLPPSVGFISVSPNTDWVCGQSSPIICTYTANGGVFSANSPSDPIIINVSAPVTVGTITNNADVKITSTLEVNTANNVASVDVAIVSGTDINTSIPLTKHIQFNINGDYALIGNTNINFSGTDPNQLYNDSVNMRYVTSAGNTGDNSSSSTLSINNAYTIRWAGLYWEGHICDATGTGTATGIGTGCNWSNSKYTSYNNATSNRTTSLGQVQFRVPGGSYQTITANTLNVFTKTPPNNNAQPRISQTYSAWADVTQLVQNAGSGTYSVADITLTEGQISNGGNYGGWSLIVVYEDSNKTLSYKNISIFNGFQYIIADNTAFNISGFLTPKSGPINASLAFFAADGDPVIGGTINMQNKSGVLTPLSNTSNPNTNTLNSTMTVFGNNINPSVTKTYGVDADRINVGTFMNNSQTNVGFSFNVTTPTGGRDHYSLSMFTFATDLTTPIIDNLTKNAIIIGKDGTRRVAEPNQVIYPGSQLEYTITFTNTGDEEAEGVEIFDDFDYDGLSQALYVNSFDATQLKLFHSDTTTNEVSNPDCGYIVNERRVYCKIDSMPINDTYTMKFVVFVKDPLDSSVFDKNASNTAYVRYRNPNDNTYVKRYKTPGLEDVGGKSNTLNAGIFTDNLQNTDRYIRINAINEFFDNAQDRNITTKLANTPFNIQLVHLDRDLQNNGYDMYNVDGVSRPMNVLVSIQGDDNVVNPPLNDPSTTFFTNNDSSIISNNLLIPNAYKNIRLKMNYLDWKTILSWANANSTCLTDAPTAVRFNGLPACFNVYHYVQDLLPTASFPEIATCYGEGNITIPAGKTYACDSRAYSLNGEPSGDIFPDVYQHNFGCFQCISEGSVRFKKASDDDLAVRPVSFNIDSQDRSFPDLLRAGLDYNLSLVALDGQGDPTQDYNITQNVSNVLKTSDPKKLLPNGSIDTNNLLAGDFNLTTGQDYNISNGISTTNNTDSDTIEDVIGIHYSDVGVIQIEIHDDNWANVDADDTPLECNATRSLNDDTISIETGRTICSDELNLTFIPHHFSVNPKLHNHRDDSNVTYLSNDLNMSAHVEVAIKAENAQNDITSNFKKDFYEHPITVELNVTDWNSTLLLNLPFDRNGTDRPDVNLKKHDIPNAQLLGFGGSNDANGTRTIAVNDTNISQRILFNYERTGSPKNPFTIQGNEVNITVQVHYISTMGADQGSIDINGTGKGNGEARFFYARIYPQEDKYDAKTTSVITPVYIQVYCDAGYPGCRNRGIDVELAQSKADWWNALNHRTDSNDGNITLMVESTKISSIDLNGQDELSLTINNSSGKDRNITVSTTVIPNRTDINLKTANTTDTSSWLIYQYTNPLYQVKFISSGIDTNDTNNSMWTGHGNTGNVVGGVNANRYDDRRLGW